MSAVWEFFFFTSELQFVNYFQKRKACSVCSLQIFISVQPTNLVNNLNSNKINKSVTENCWLDKLLSKGCIDLTINHVQPFFPIILDIISKWDEHRETDRHWICTVYDTDVFFLFLVFFFWPGSLYSIHYVFNIILSRLEPGQVLLN